MVTSERGVVHFIRLRPMIRQDVIVLGNRNRYDEPRVVFR